LFKPLTTNNTLKEDLKMYREMTTSRDVALNNDQIMMSAPSVFSEGAKHDVSDRYRFIPTIQMVDALRREGWYPVDATQKNVRDKSNTDFTKHLVRFRRLDNEVMLGDSNIELLLQNAHDRTSSYILHAGLFRMACANGIVIADSTLKRVSVRHSTNCINKVIEGSYHVIKETPKIAESVEGMQAIELDRGEQLLLANAAREYTMGDDDTIVTSADNINNQLLKRHRRSDMGDDLWSTFNVIQENIIKGGVRMIKNGPKGMRRNSTRAVKAIDKDIKLNKALWGMAEAMRELKG
jgi:hypothetical protein